MPSSPRGGPDVDQKHGERRWLQDRDALTCGVGWWAWEDLNLRLHPDPKIDGEQAGGSTGAAQRSRVQAVGCAPTQAAGWRVTL